MHSEYKHSLWYAWINICNELAMIRRSGTVFIVFLTLLRLVIFCLIGSNSYEFYFLLHVALESCFKYIIFVELQNNIQFVVWSSFRDYQEYNIFLYYTSIVLVCQYIVSRIVYRGNSVVCFTKATSPPRKIILSTFHAWYSETWNWVEH